MNEDPTAPPPPYDPPPPPPFSDPGGGSDSGPRLPWEERQQLGFLDALVATIRLLVTAPDEAFSRLKADGDLVSPILFGVILSWFGNLFAQFWNLLLGPSMRSMLGDVQGAAFYGGTSVLQMLVILIITPILYLIFLFLSAGIFHLCLMLAGAVERSPTGFEGTLKVCAYSSVASLGSLIPILGWLVSLVASILLMVLGFARVHRTDHGRAVAAVLIPMAICCVCVVLAFVLFGAAIFAAMAGAAAAS